MRTLENHTLDQTHVGLNKLMIPKRNWDAKKLENFIFNVEQYFKATRTCSQDLKVTLATMHLVGMQNSSGAQRGTITKMNDAPLFHGKTSLKS